MKYTYKHYKSDFGYTSLTTLLMLIFVLVIACGLAGMVNILRQPLERLQEQVTGHGALASSIAEFQKLITENGVRTSDSKFSPMWQLNGKIINEWKVHIEDASSRLNLNWINLNILENTPLGLYIKPGKTITDLRQYREAIGFTYNFEKVYEDFFSKNSVDLLFTPYSYANINVSFETCMETMYRFLTDDTGAHSSFRVAIQAHLLEGKLWKDEELKNFLGMQAKTVYPYINALPSMNVNFIPEEILSAVLKYPFPEGLLINPEDIKNQILSIRASAEITPEQLQSLLVFTNEQQKRVAEYLGTRTWCWKIWVEKDGQDPMSTYLWAPTGL